MATDTPLLSLLTPVNAIDGTENLYIVKTGETPRDRRLTIGTMLASLLDARFKSLRVSTTGDGTQIDGIYRLKTATGISTGAIAAAGSFTQTYAITGILANDQVIVSAIDNDLDGIILTARWTALNTVTVRYYNPTAASKTPPSHALAFTVIR